MLAWRVSLPERGREGGKKSDSHSCLVFTQPPMGRRRRRLVVLVCVCVYKTHPHTRVCTYLKHLLLCFPQQHSGPQSKPLNYALYCLPEGECVPLLQSQCRRASEKRDWEFGAAAKKGTEELTYFRTYCAGAQATHTYKDIWDINSLIHSSKPVHC